MTTATDPEVAPTGLPPTIDAALTAYITSIIAAKQTLATAINTGMNVASPPPVPYAAWRVLARILDDSINPIQVWANDQNPAPNQVGFTASLNPTFHTLLEGEWPPINPYLGSTGFGTYTWSKYSWATGGPH